MGTEEGGHVLGLPETRAAAARAHRDFDPVSHTVPTPRQARPRRGLAFSPLTLWAAAGVNFKSASRVG
jgi:hypothetical protein